MEGIEQNLSALQVGNGDFASDAEKLAQPEAYLTFLTEGRSQDKDEAREELLAWAKEKCTTTEEDEDGESSAASTDNNSDSDEPDEEDSDVDSDASSVSWQGPHTHNDIGLEDEGMEVEEAEQVKAEQRDGVQAGPSTSSADPSLAGLDPFLIGIQQQLTTLRKDHTSALEQVGSTSTTRKNRAHRLDNRLDAERFVGQQYRRLLHKTQRELVFLTEAKLKVEEVNVMLKLAKEEAEKKQHDAERASHAAHEAKFVAEAKLAMIREAHDLERGMYLGRIKELSEGRAGTQGA